MTYQCCIHCLHTGKARHEEACGVSDCVVGFSLVYVTDPETKRVVPERLERFRWIVCQPVRSLSGRYDGVVKRFSGRNVI